MKKIVVSMILSAAFNVCYASTKSTMPYDNLCSPEGVAKLVPAFRDSNGHFAVPDPVTDLPRFLQAYDALRNVIAVTLAQAATTADPYTVGSQSFTRLRFDKNWVASEVGFEQQGDKIPDFTKSPFGYYGGTSFLENIVQVNGTGGAIYVVPHKGVFISPLPTILPCVNVLMETSSNDSGTFVSPSYALGTKDGTAFMLVNGCQNTTTTTTINNKKVMTPRASGYLGIQVNATYFKKQ